MEAAISLTDIFAIIISLAALFAFLNYRLLKLPMTIGLMAIALATSVLVIVLDALGVPLKQYADRLITSIDFNDTLLNGMLSYLLFAGALHVNFDDLKQQKWVIAILASFGVLLSTFLVSMFSYYVLRWLGIELPYIYCLLFGALISPTDPIAVLGILKQVGAPKSLETKITGESLFNDGVGVVVFLVIAGIAFGGESVSPAAIAELFVIEALGGAIFGMVTGWIAYRMIRSVDNYSVEILVTLALVAGGYALASALHLSGPIAMVVAGLLIGNQGRSFAMSANTRKHLDTFWELVDEILNAVLFVLIGMEVLILKLSWPVALAGILLIGLVLLSRYIAVSLPVALLSLRRTFTPQAAKIMTWGGLRGGISVALALAIPPGEARDIILPITYFIVVFSILVQGMTVGKLIASSTNGEATNEP